MNRKISIWPMIIITIMLSLSSIVSINVQAATYISIKPGKELCTSVVFGQQGRGEYTIESQEPANGPWIDNHYTSFIAGPENVIQVPICFSARGRELGDNANIRVVLTSPSGGRQVLDYGICVSKFEDVDVVEGGTGNPCQAMAMHTDIFSAALTQPEMYAEPGEAVLFTLLLDSSLPLTLDIAKGAGGLNIAASKSAIEAGQGQQEVLLRLSAPSAPGDYNFSVVATAQGCTLSDCSRAVKGVLHVRTPQQQPQAGFYAWLSPETKSIMGQQSTMYVLKFQNYDNGQDFTATVATDPGLETGFAPYTAFVAKGDSKSVTFTVRPSTADIRTYKLTGTVTAADGSERKAEAWLTVDEMVADAMNIGGQDAFIERYNESGGASLEDWQDLRTATGTDGKPIAPDTVDDVTPPQPGPNYLLLVTMGVIVGIILILIFLIYKRMYGKEEGTTWESLGV